MRVVGLNLVLAADAVVAGVWGFLVFATARPDAALAANVDERARAAIADGRRAFAVTLLALGCVTFAVAAYVEDRSILVFVAEARLGGAIALAVTNAMTLRGGRWRRPPVLFALGASAALGVAYGVVLLLPP